MYSDGVWSRFIRISEVLLYYMLQFISQIYIITWKQGKQATLTGSISYTIMLQFISQIYILILTRNLE